MLTMIMYQSRYRLPQPSDWPKKNPLRIFLESEETASIRIRSGRHVAILAGFDNSRNNDDWQMDP